MSFDFRNIRALGKRISVPIPKDEDGFLGRECPQPDCEGYFKIKPGTGLIGDDLPCRCAYCGHAGPQDQFWTKEQIAYGRSVVHRKLDEALRRDLKSLDFEVKPKGPFGIGISMKLQPGRPVPIHHYREKALETLVKCELCTLEYAVYGVFAYCPDCGAHNSVQILGNNLGLVRKQVALAQAQEDAALRRHLIEDALENCVSAFDGFGREACRIRAPKSTNPATCGTVSFQNLPRAAARVKDLFGVDLAGVLPAGDWSAAHVSFMRRHLLAHRSGVVDQQYLGETGEPPALLGRRIDVSVADVERLVALVEALGSGLVALLPTPG